MVGILVLTALFKLSEDFRPVHLVRIDTPAALQRAGMSEQIETQLVPRTDERGAADWLTRYRGTTPALLVNAVPGTDYYFRNFDVSYIDQGSRRFRAYACERGTKDRWSNLPLVYSVAQLRERIAQVGNAFIVVGQHDAPFFFEGLSAWNPRTVWKSLDGEIMILAVTAT
jgi:hypothetical protein